MQQLTQGRVDGFLLKSCNRLSVTVFYISILTYILDKNVITHLQTCSQFALEGDWTKEQSHIAMVTNVLSFTFSLWN